MQNEETPYSQTQFILDGDRWFDLYIPELRTTLDGVTPADMDAISSLLINHPELKKLVFDGQGCRRGLPGNLLPSLRKSLASPDCPVQTLILHTHLPRSEAADNFRNHEFSRALHSIFRENRSLRYLHIEGSNRVLYPPFGDGLRMNNTLRELSISGVYSVPLAIQGLCRAVTASNTLRKLRLDECVLSSSDFDALGGMLSENSTSLVSLSLNGNTMSSADMEALAKGLQHNSHLKTLHLNATLCRSDTFHYLQQGLDSRTSRSTLTSLDLSCNPLLSAPPGARTLARLLEFTPTLKTLNAGLLLNTMGTEVAQFKHEVRLLQDDPEKRRAMKDHTLNTLVLPIAWEGTAQLPGPLLNLFPSMTSLEIGNTLFTVAAPSREVPVNPPYTTCLELLAMESNLTSLKICNPSFHQHFHVLVEHIARQNTLETFSLNGSLIQDTQVQYMCRLIASPGRLCNLSFGLSMESIHDLQFVLDALSVPTCTLKYVHLVVNTQDCDIVGPIGRMLALNQHLEVFRIESRWSVPCTSNGYKVLMRALQTNKTLRSLDLENCNLRTTVESDEPYTPVGAAWAKALSINKTLTRLYLRCYGHTSADISTILESVSTSVSINELHTSPPIDVDHAPPIAIPHTMEHATTITIGLDPLRDLNGAIPRYVICNASTQAEKKALARRRILKTLQEHLSSDMVELAVSFMNETIPFAWLDAKYGDAQMVMDSDIYPTSTQVGQWAALKDCVDPFNGRFLPPVLPKRPRPVGRVLPPVPSKHARLMENSQ